MSSLPSRLRLLRELRGIREFVLFMYLTAFAACVPLLMRLPLPRLSRLVGRPPRRRSASAERVDRLAALMSLAVRFGYPLVRPGCLTRGVTLLWFMRREGIDVELRFGLDALDHRAADGHCWLVLGGEPILEKVDPRPRFAELYRLPVAAA